MEEETRAAFEKWVKEHPESGIDLDCLDENGDYRYSEPIAAWMAWQACERHYRAAQTPGETCPTCRSDDRSKRYYDAYHHMDCTDPWHSPAPAPQTNHYPIDAGYCSCGVLCETGTRFRQHLKEVSEPAPQKDKE